MDRPEPDNSQATGKRMVPLRTVLIVAAVSVALIVAAGFLHVVHGGGVGFTVCAKDGWAIEDTFVDLDDYIGQSLLSKIDKAKVLRAMFACRVLTRPGTSGEQHESRRASRLFGESRVDTTKLKLKKYAFEAYPSWSTAHPDKACPEKLSDLNEYMNNDDSNDSWGHPIKMLCGANLPAGARGIAVMSAAEDGKYDTEDDLKSWE